MKHSVLDAGVPLFRAHNPKWAFKPLSGAGAASAGGRFNRPGVAALYLSTEQVTAAAEYQQDNDITDPYLMVAYLSTLPPLVDLRLIDDDWDALWRDWDCDWRQLVVEGVEPPSWTLSDMLLTHGETGLIFPSIADAGGINVVLFSERISSDALVPHDPQHLLPADQESWKSR